MKIILASAAIGAMSAVILGAFAAHGLKTKLSELALTAFQTGVQYQMYHSLALVLLVLLYRQQAQSMLLYSAYFFIAGILLFSGSLYLLSLTGNSWFGPITPIGGMCFIIGWALLVYSTVRS